MNHRAEHLAEGVVTLHCGDCLDVLKTLEANSVDAVVTDPPYGIGFMGREWDTFSPAGVAKRAEQKRRKGTSPPPGHGALNSRGFVEYDFSLAGEHRFQAWCLAWSRELFRVLKPGAHLLAFGGTRTYHRMACAIEDAGFEIRDSIQWLYGSGFPKSLDVSKAIDKAAGAEREVVGRKADPRYQSPADAASGSPMGNISPRVNGGINYERAGFVTAAATDEAAQWQGFGTALKPACEPIVLARKPLAEVTSAELHKITGCDHWCSERTDSERKVIVRTARALHSGARSVRIHLDPKTRRELSREDTGAYQPFNDSSVCANVLKWGTGALNIDGARVAAYDGDEPMGWESPRGGIWKTDSEADAPLVKNNKGRWPANVIHDGSDEVVGAFPETKSGELLPHHRKSGNGLSGTSTFEIRDRTGEAAAVYGDQGSAARFFYSAKADADDRLGSRHPTIKPVDLDQYLCRLVGRKGAVILDPFAGTGTLGEACIREGMRAILIEKEEEYQDDIRRRMKLAMAGPDERARESIKARNKDKPVDHGPLFGGSDTPPHWKADLRSVRGRTIRPTGLKW